MRIHIFILVLALAGSKLATSTQSALDFIMQLERFADV